MKVIFTWTIEGATKEETDAENERIADAFVKGNLGEFIQEVLGGDVLQLPTVTPAEKQAFAIRKLTQLNLQSIDQAEIESAIAAMRQAVESDKRNKRELPELPRRPKAPKA